MLSQKCRALTCLQRNSCIMGLTLCLCAVIFQLYDTDGDGFVTSDNVLTLLRQTAGKALLENQLQQARLLQALNLLLS